MGVKYTVILSLITTQILLAKGQKVPLTRDVVASVLRSALGSSNPKAAQMLRMSVPGQNIPEMPASRTIYQAIADKPMFMRSQMADTPMAVRRLQGMPISTVQVQMPVSMQANRPEIVMVREIKMPGRDAALSMQFRQEPQSHNPKNVNQNLVEAKEIQIPQMPVNPYLPLASPMSALAASTSGQLPSMVQSKSRHLRKIPIPPPTL